ncbi:hypothetical protein ACQUQP_14300 [Marinobacterium sp. YM272]|uniref:hypothetical protein n=1 Tax=Marinobacterium sp. YM272 TaxID=3421654 RepID=UPI003D7FF77D
MSMKVVAWLLVTLAAIYFLVLAAFIAYHYIRLGSLAGHTWFFRAPELAAVTIVSCVALLVGVGLLKAKK